MMGSGKTTLGQKLAEELSLPFFDTDEIIASIEGMSVSEIFKTKGEEYFRQSEQEIINHWKISDGIVSTGGGLPCYNSLIEVLNNKGKTVFLKTSTETLVERIINDQTRPLIAGKSKLEIRKTISDLLKIRNPVYSKAKIKINTQGMIEDVIKKIIVKLYS